MSKYIFPESLRAFGFVPVEEYRASLAKCASGYRACMVPVFLANGCFTDVHFHDIYIDHSIIAVQVSPVPCEKAKVWSVCISPSTGNPFLIKKGNHVTGLSSFTKEEQNAIVDALNDLLERQENP